jgi:hypothetical protein
MTGFWLSLNAALAVIPGLLTSQKVLTDPTLTIALAIAYVALALVDVIGGVVSQHIGRRNYLMFSSIASAIFGTFFYYWLISTPSSPAGLRYSFDNHSDEPLIGYLNGQL